MKTILVPTDFSKNAENAFIYAIEIAKKESAKIVLLHVYEIDYANSYVPYDSIMKEKETAKKESEIKLKKLTAKYKLIEKVKFETLTIESSIVDGILDTIKNKKTDLVVMGTKGITNFSEVIFGSHTSKIVEKAKCPVIAVPQDVVFNGFKKITYATAFNNCDLNALKNTAEIARLFNAQLNVLHISGDSHSPQTEKDMMEKLMKEINNEIEYNNLSFQLLGGENIEESLEKYIQSNATDLLVMSTHQRDFFDKIFGQSVTKQTMYHTHVPLMAFHYNMKSSVKVFSV